MDQVYLNFGRRTGWKRGNMRYAVVRGDSGFSFTVELSRGMDISRASFQDVNIGYLEEENLPVAGRGYANACRQRRFFYGLLSTCGLENTGQPCDGSEGECCLHGSVNLSAAEGVKAHAKDGRVVIEGRVGGRFEEWKNLYMFRRLTYDDSRVKITIEDEVANVGKKDEQVCLMYHYNFGEPFLDAGCEMELSPVSVVPKNEVAEKMRGEFGAIRGKTKGYPPHVFYCVLEEGEGGVCVASLRNKSLGIRASVSYHADTLPKMDLWKCFSDERYVMAFEPCNEFPLGRYGQREKGMARYVPPGGRVRYVTEFCLVREGVSGRSNK